MNTSKYHVIGVMSGTSLDGIDLCYIRFDLKKKWSFKIIEAETLNYDNNWKKKLGGSINLTNKSLEELDCAYSFYLSQIISKFIEHNGITEIDAICSHGHTVFHQPQEGITKQIGNKELLSETLNQQIVCDFRIQDVELGGQGAPLVPIGDELLFKEYDYCLNLGGFANVSFNTGRERIAFDICPVNILFNHFANIIDLDYDRDGEIASSGTINMRLLQELNDLEYYKQSHPKSLGIEWVNTNVFPLINNQNLEVNDILRTLTEHMAIQISSVLNNEIDSKVLVTGGGAYNSFLISRIQALTQTQIRIPENNIVDFKEALIFGLLGVLRLRNEVNCLASVTGAKHDHSSGNIFNP